VLLAERVYNEEDVVTPSSQASNRSCIYTNSDAIASAAIVC
jgi:hypothetical protein